MPDHALQCMEVWGGNSAADAGVVMAGLDARVFSLPLGAGVESGTGGGDVYYVSSCASGRITRMLVADVSGHGAPVAETGAQLRRSMRRFVNHVDQRGFLRSLNRDFIESPAPGFATAAAVSYFGPTRELSVSLAGHPAPLLRRARDGRWSLLRSADGGDAPRTSALPLGVDDSTSFAQFRIRLEVGDLVVLYTDALIEARCPDGALLGEEGLLRLAAGIGTGEPAVVVDELRERLTELAPGNLTDDDVTMLAFRPNGLGDRTPIAESLRAPVRMIGAAFRRLRPGGDPFPWPEISLRTMGGPLGRLAARREQRPG